MSNSFMVRLVSLHNWLKKAGLDKSAQMVKGLTQEEVKPEINNEEMSDEDWHNEVINEYGSEPISEDEYLMNEMGVQLKPDDYSDYGAKYHIDLNNVFNDILKQHNIAVVSIGGKSPILGSGVYGSVIDVIYKGKPAVAKIIIKRDDAPENEANNWKHVLNNMDKFTPEQIKHLPIIYDIIQDEIESYNYKYGGYNIFEYSMIIMEKLFPVPKEIESLFDSGNIEQDAKSLDFALKDEETIYEIALSISQYIQAQLNKRGSTIKLTEKNIQDIFQILLSKVSAPITKDKEEWKSIMTKLIIDYLQRTFNQRFDSLSIDIRTVIARAIDETSEFPPYEHAYSARHKKWDILPETKNFISALKTMADELDLSWTDLHQRNIMINADGNLKIIDIGLYHS